MTEPGVSNRGLCRADDEEFQRIQTDLERMQNVAFDFLKNPRGEKPKREDVFDQGSKFSEKILFGILDKPIESIDFLKRRFNSCHFWQNLTGKRLPLRKFLIFSILDLKF